MKQHILLVGLPGAGKSTVGKLVAERLRAPFVDPDTVIVRRMQMPIGRIFAEHGELRFREMERDAVVAALAGPASVIAPGGGWAAQDGQIEAARANSFVVYLRMLAMTASKRLAAADARPLLVGVDPVEKMRQLLKERESFYLKADAEVKGDVKTPQQLADEIVELARQRAGWAT